MLDDTWCRGRSGAEVTISYGAFPNDVFLLFFGFVPDPNPHDAVLLFADLHDLASVAAETASAATQLAPQAGRASANALQSRSAVTGPTAGHAATGNRKAGQGDPTVQQAAEDLETMLLERLPPGDYSRCYAFPCARLTLCSRVLQCFTRHGLISWSLS